MTVYLFNNVVHLLQSTNVMIRLSYLFTFYRQQCIKYQFLSIYYIRTKLFAHPTTEVLCYKYVWQQI